MPVINPKAGQPANCPATSRYEASKRGKAPKAQKLNELPDADVYRAVYRRIGRLRGADHRQISESAGR